MPNGSQLGTLVGTSNSLANPILKSSEVEKMNRYAIYKDSPIKWFGMALLAATPMAEIANHSLATALRRSCWNLEHLLCYTRFVYMQYAFNFFATWQVFFTGGRRLACAASPRERA
jgi:hypothetical protein